MNRTTFRNCLKRVGIAVLVAFSTTGFAFAADVAVKTPPPPKPKEVPFFFVNDTAVSGIWYFNATDPGVPGDSNIVPGGVAGQLNSFWRAQGAIDHFDAWEYGTNLIHIEIDQYSSKDPIQGQPGATGSRELFSFARSTFGWNELTHSKMFATPLTNDIGFEVGFNAGVQNNFLAEQTTVYVMGLNFDLKVPKPFGTLLVGVMADKEWTHNEFNACSPTAVGVGSGGGSTAFAGGTCATGAALQFSGNRDFDWTWRVETFYTLPLGPILGSWAESAHIVNIFNLIGPKGTGISTANCNAVGFGGSCTALNPFALNSSAFTNNETKTELFEDVRLTVDMSKLYWGKPGIWDTFIGYRYWQNKFGTNHSAPLFSLVAPGTSIESTAYIGATYHFK
jgi:hypothetical protein